MRVKAATAQPRVQPIPRTGEGLRDMLYDEIDLLRSGGGDRRRALALAMLAREIIGTVKLEIRYQQHLAMMSQVAGEAPADKSAIPTLKLGSVNGRR